MLDWFKAAGREDGIFAYYRRLAEERRGPQRANSLSPSSSCTGAYDYTCETIDFRLAEPMRRDCADLTEVVVHSGHWMAQERPVDVNAALVKWLATKSPDAWPT